jgi:hypothetical protein
MAPRPESFSAGRGSGFQYLKQPFNSIAYVASVLIADGAATRENQPSDSMRRTKMNKKKTTQNGKHILPKYKPQNTISKAERGKKAAYDEKYFQVGDNGCATIIL